MNFLRRIFRTQIKTPDPLEATSVAPLEETRVAPLKETSVNLVEDSEDEEEIIPVGLEFNWEEYQRTLDLKENSTIGGPHFINYRSTVMHMCDLGGVQSFVYSFSPSGRYMLSLVHKRSVKYTKNLKNPDFFRDNVTGMAPIMQITDFSNRRRTFYANEKVISNRNSPSVVELTTFLTLYWISDYELVIVHLKNLFQIIQCVCTFNHESRTFTEEIYEYAEFDDKLENDMNCEKTTVNPLFIENKAYFTLLVEYNFYLFPWIPNKNNIVKKIKLNKNDAIFEDGDYYLITGKNAFYFNYGHRSFFYFGDEYDTRHLVPEIEAYSTKIACIDFSKHEDIYLTGDAELPFEIVDFTDIAAYWFDQYIFVSNYGNYPRNLTCHGRYILYNPHDVGKRCLIFDLQNMTVDIIDEKWLTDCVMCSNTLFRFHSLDTSTSTIGYHFEHLEQPGVQSLANLCRQKLIYSETRREVPKKLLNIIFPST